MKTRFTFDMSAFEKRLEGAVKKTGAMASRATKESAEEIMEESRKQVPKDTFTLANDTFVKTSNTLTTATTEFGYTGNAINPKENKYTRDYMIEVHEDLSARHPVGKAKFLEDPIINYSDSGDDVFGKKVADALKGLFGL